MSPKKPVSSDIITWLEISAVDENNFIALPKVYTLESMPVDTSSIPTNDNLSRFLCLREVSILTIKARGGARGGLGCYSSPWISHSTPKKIMVYLLLLFI